MEKKQSLPFKVGQLAESKSFEEGFRGAWFRCKIIDIRLEKGLTQYALEFYDYEDEEVGWTDLYQKPLPEEEKMHLMVRPSFPPVYQESQVPDTISEVIAVFDGIWKVGDLVDWCTNSCYWSGQVIQLVGDDTVKIKLPEPPVGEGQTYDALCKDLRPSLDWSPEHGWTVPISKEIGARRCCACLIRPAYQAERPRDDLAEEAASFKLSNDSSANSVSLQGSEGFLPTPMSSSIPPTKLVKQPSEVRFVGMDLGDGNTTKPNSVKGGSTAHAEDLSATAATKTTGRKDRYNYNGSSRKMQVGGAEYFNSSFSDTIESSIMDLEELASRIKWLQRVHEFGFDSASAMTPSWKFLVNRIPLKHN